MADFLSTGVSGLQAFQRALDTTSQNIANVATEGYSRQRTEITTRPPQPFGNGWIGAGVTVDTVTRLYDNLLAQQVQSTNSGFSSADTFATQAARVNNIFADTNTGLSTSLQNFTNALQDVANNPTSIPSRQALLSQAQVLTDRFKSYDTQLKQIGSDVEAQFGSEVTQINTLGSSIAQLNKQIAAGFAQTGQPPNDLLDQRDKLLDRLSQHIDISLSRQDDGQVNVFVGSGQALVLAGNASQLTALTDPYDASRHGIGLKTGTATIDITANTTGGTLGGLVDFRRELLDPARDTLGQLSAGLVEAVNTQHAAGIDLNGALGGPLFSIGGAKVQPSSNNGGSGALTVTRTSAGALTGENYILKLTATGWDLRNADTGAAVTLAGAGTVASPYTADGLAIVVSGTANVGDSFLIQPTRTAVTGLNVAISDPTKVAAAAPIRTAANPANSGSATISQGSVVDATNAALRSPVTIQFLTASTYSINGAGSFAYTAGSPITANGWQVEIDGTPAAGDQFTVSDNTGGAGDNRNALALASALGQPVLNGGTTSVNDAASQFYGSIGIQTQQAQANRDAQKVVNQDAVSARDSVSGVNLDEEAANMLRYQQAYQAAAQVIRVASTLFDTLISVASRA